MLLLRFKNAGSLMIQGILAAIEEYVLFYAYTSEKWVLLRNISKIYCQIARICYNKSVATFWQQKISKPL